MKKKVVANLYLKKTIISNFKNSIIKGGNSDPFGRCGNANPTEWGGCGSDDDCQNTGSYFCATSIVVCNQECPSGDI